MAGIRTSYENGTFMTSQEAYREGIVAADNYAAINTWASPADRVAELGLDLAERVLTTYQARHQRVCLHGWYRATYQCSGAQQ